MFDWDRELLDGKTDESPCMERKRRSHWSKELGKSNHSKTCSQKVPN